jgi:hypothetical protein
MIGWLKARRAAQQKETEADARAILADKYDVPQELHGVWFAGIGKIEGYDLHILKVQVKRGERPPLTPEESRRRPNYMVRYWDEGGKYIGYSVGAVVPMIWRDGNVAYYRINRWDRGYGDNAGWDDGHKYDLELVEVCPYKGDGREFISHACDLCEPPRAESGRP